MEKLILVSTGDVDIFPENTRSIFRNNLPSEYYSNKKLVLSLEQIYIDKQFRNYENLTDIPDIIISNDKNVTRELKIEYSDNILNLCEQMLKIFNEYAMYVKLLRPCMQYKITDHKVELRLKAGKVIFSSKLYKFLCLDNYVSKKEINDETYYMMRRLNDDEIFYYTPKLKMNEKEMEYIKIICDIAEGFHDSQKITKEIMKIPIIGKTRHIFHNIDQKIFSKLTHHV